MKNIIILVLLLSTYLCANNKEKEDTVYFKWIPKGVAGLNVSQTSFTNWSQGGENSIAWVTKENFGLYYNAKVWRFKNDLQLAFGRMKLGEAKYRTVENDLYLESVFTKLIGWDIDPYFSNTIRTTITTGYKYTDSSETRIADFFDPGYVTQSLGFNYKEGGFSSRIGVALQETFTNNYREYSDNKETLDKLEAFKLETGIESVTDAKYELDQNVLFNSKLRLFTRFTNMDVWDVRWDNSITAKINKFVNVNFNVLMIYEKSQSYKTQFKEALLLGVTYSFF